MSGFDLIGVSAAASSECVHPAHYACTALALGKLDPSNIDISALCSVAPYEIVKDLNDYRLVVWVDDNISDEQRLTCPSVRVIVNGSAEGQYVNTCFLAIYEKRLSNNTIFRRGVRAGNSGGSASAPSTLSLPNVSEFYEAAVAAGVLELQWKAPGEYESTRRWGRSIHVAHNLDGSTAVRAVSHTVRACASCGTVAATKHCVACNAVHYCNRECQLAHWPQHKRACRAARS